MVRQRLAQLIRAAKVSQAEIARRMGEDRDWVNNRVIGRVGIDAEELPRFAAALGVSPCAFFEEVAPPAAEVKLAPDSVKAVAEVTADTIRGGILKVELSDRAIERIGVELAHVVAPATAEAVVRALRQTEKEQVHEIARRKTAELAHRWEELSEEEQEYVWRQIEERRKLRQRETPAERELPER